MNRPNFLVFVGCVFIIISSCKNKIEMNNQEISSDDEFEKSQKKKKNWSFSECYTQSKYNTYKRLGIDIKDSCFTKSNVADLTGYFYINNSDIDLHLIFEDSNRIKLVEKWVNDINYIPKPINPPDFPDGSLDLVRALDFYNSEDLKKYIDSLRNNKSINIAPAANSR